MTTSDDINELAPALAKAQGAMVNAAKDTKNPFFGSKYADLASVWDACRKPLSDNGLSIVQLPDVQFQGAPEFESYKTKSGDERWRAKVITTVTVITRLLHSSGQWIEDEIQAVLPSGDPQSIGSAITYLRRYALSALVGVAPEDDDAEATTQQAPAKPAKLQKQDGYDDWLIDLQAVAAEGEAALKKAWEASSKERRAYLLADDPQGWTAIKAHAKSADERRAAAPRAPEQPSVLVSELA